jgi:hypothetical protein
MSRIIKNNSIGDLETLGTLNNSQFYELLEGKSDELIMITPHLQKFRTVNRTVVNRQLTKLIKGLKNKKGLIPAVAIKAYRPDVECFKFYDPIEGIITLNEYRPPSYLNNNFWIKNEAEYETILDKKLEKSYNPPETWNELIPKIYLDFFNHLCSNNKESLEYLIDWMAVAVDPTMRNLTTLVLIAKQGVGKGVFFESILRFLFGEHNSVQLRGQDALESRFNQSFANKRIIFLDEVQLKDTRALNRFKMFANVTMEIEQKGKDPIYVKNWANTLIAANDLDAIKLEQDDRRFSILQVTNTRLEEFCAQHDQYKTVQELRANLENLNNIKDLYNFLISHKPERVMSYAFNSIAKVDEIKDAGLAEWERAALEICDSSYKEGYRTLTMINLQSLLKGRNGLMQVPGRIKIKALFNAFKNVATFKQDSNTGEYFLKLNGIYESAFSVDKSESIKDIKDVKGTGINIKINSKIDGGVV